MMTPYPRVPYKDERDVIHWPMCHWQILIQEYAILNGERRAFIMKHGSNKADLYTLTDAEQLAIEDWALAYHMYCEKTKQIEEARQEIVKLRQEIHSLTDDCKHLLEKLQKEVM